MVIDTNQIYPGLYMGGYQPMGAPLAAEGFHTLALCARELQPPPDWYPGVTSIYRALLEDDPRKLTRVERMGACQVACAVLRDLVAGKKCLVTCAAGINRSGLVTALVVNRLLGIPGPEVLKLLRKQRDPAVLSNPLYAYLVEQLPAREPYAATPATLG